MAAEVASKNCVAVLPLLSGLGQHCLYHNRDYVVGPVADYYSTISVLVSNGLSCNANGISLGVYYGAKETGEV